MKILLTLLLAGLTFTGYAQERKFLDQDHKPVTDSALAVYYTETTMTDSVAGVEKVFFKRPAGQKAKPLTRTTGKRSGMGPAGAGTKMAIWLPTGITGTENWTDN